MSPKFTLTDTIPLSKNSYSSSDQSAGEDEGEGDGGAANARKMPRLGFGVYQSPPELCYQSCLEALRIGYRHIDTAQFYANEAEVGRAVRDAEFLSSSNPDSRLGNGDQGGQGQGQRQAQRRQRQRRSQVFLTTKILSAAGSVDKSYEKCLASVERIDPGEDGYVDLFLIHSPNCGREKRQEMWTALERLYANGRAKSIGVSNYGIGHIEEIKGYAQLVWPPHVNQIELHPYCQQKRITAYCIQNSIAIQAYSPLVRNLKGHEQTLVKVAAKYSQPAKSTAQILIRYSLQKGWTPLPKSDDPARIAENADVFDFDISEDDMQILDGLDRGQWGAVVQAVDNDAG